MEYIAMVYLAGRQKFIVRDATVRIVRITKSKK